MVGEERYSGRCATGNAVSGMTEVLSYVSIPCRSHCQPERASAAVCKPWPPVRCYPTVDYAKCEVRNDIRTRVYNEPQALVKCTQLLYSERRLDRMQQPDV